MGASIAVAIAIHNVSVGRAAGQCCSCAGAGPGLLGQHLCGLCRGRRSVPCVSCIQIPEGICVAMPIYYSTGSKWQASAACMGGIALLHAGGSCSEAMPHPPGRGARPRRPVFLPAMLTRRLFLPTATQGFLWGSLTGFAEPLGGLIGYLAVHERVSPKGDATGHMHLCPCTAGAVARHRAVAAASALQKPYSLPHRRALLLSRVPAGQFAANRSSSPRPPAAPAALLIQDPLSFAIVFGLISGMMVYVSVKELLPSAFRFDPKDTLASASECGAAPVRSRSCSTAYGGLPWGDQNMAAVGCR